MISVPAPEDISRCLARPEWDSRSGNLTFTCTNGKVIYFKVSAEVNEEVLSPAKWEILPGGIVRGMAGGFELRLEFKAVPGHDNARAAVTCISNLTALKAKFGGFRFSAAEKILPACSSDLRIYKEGWAMTSPAASVRYGEKEFYLNPDYKPFATSVPATYDDKTPNRFVANYTVILNDKTSGENVLAGFISTEAQAGRFDIELDAKGLASFDAVCDGDGIELAPGEQINSEELVVMSGTDGYSLLEAFAWLWGARMKAITWNHIPTGWCSWTYYFERITQADMLENSSWLRDHRQDYPLEYVQMDDGYQAALGDWLMCDSRKVPDGLEFLAGKIKSEGFKPGIWVAPFLVAECSQLYTAHAEWMVKDKNGQTVWAMPDWRGSRVAILDCTKPEACAWLTETFATLSRYGFEYVKLDFLVHEAGILALGGVYADPRATRVQAIRRGLQAIRKGMGDDKFILGCTNVLGAGVGIINGCRISTDFLPSWNINGEPYKEAPTLPNVFRNVINRRYMHGRLWVNDADAHIARIDNNKLTEDEVRMFTAALWITGGMILTGDRFSTLVEERGRLFQMLLKDLDAFDDVRTLDLFEEEYPAIWLGRSTKDNGRIVIGAFNFDETPKTLRVELNQAGFPAGSKAKVREFWSQEYLGEIDGSLQSELKAHSCKIFLLEA